MRDGSGRAEAEEGGPGAEVPVRGSTADAAYRGFLFADLRDFTAFVDAARSPRRSCSMPIEPSSANRSPRMREPRSARRATPSTSYSHLHARLSPADWG